MCSCEKSLSILTLDPLQLLEIRSPRSLLFSTLSNPSLGRVPSCCFLRAPPPSNYPSIPHFFLLHKHRGCSITTHSSLPPWQRRPREAVDVSDGRFAVPGPAEVRFGWLLGGCGAGGSRGWRCPGAGRGAELALVWARHQR